MLDALAAATEAPVTTIIHTHAHVDHVGSDAEFQSVTQIIAHTNTKANMERMDAFKGPNARLLPNRTFTDRMTLLDGQDQIDLYYFGPGHTNGDVVVVFPQKQLAAFGDLFPSKAAPVIDTANGGSGVAFPQTLASSSEIKGVTRGMAMSRRASDATPESLPSTLHAASHDLARRRARGPIATAVQEAFKAGKSAEDAAASLVLPDRYKAYDLQQAKANVQVIYGELRK